MDIDQGLTTVAHSNWSQEGTSAGRSENAYMDNNKNKNHVNNNNGNNGNHYGSSNGSNKNSNSNSKDIPLTLEHLHNAFTQWVEGSNPESQREAQEWVQNQKERKEMLYLCPNILQQSKNQHVRFLAAVTLQSYIQWHWSDISFSERKELLELLLMQITLATSSTDTPHTSYGGSFAVTLARICLCVADIAIQSLLHEWPDMVSDLFSRFLPSGNGSTIYGDHPLLLLLSFLPEQLRTIPGLTVQARDRAREKLSEEIPQVLRLVTAYLDSEVHCVSSLRCLRSWLDLHPFSEYIVQFPELLDTLFRYLADVQYANVTADIIVQILSDTASLHDKVEVLEDLTTRILRLRSTVNAKYFCGDYSHSVTICLVDLIENYGVILMRVGKSHLLLSLLEFLLLCMSKSDRETSEQCFPAWVGVLQVMNAAVEEGVDGLQFSPILYQLACTIRDSCIVDSQLLDGSFELDVELVDFRVHAKECLLEVYSLIEQDLLRYYVNLLDKDIKNGNDWKEIEADLFCILAISDTAACMRSSDNLIGMTFALSDNFPNHIIVHKLVLNMIRDYSEVMGRRPKLISGCLNTLRRCSKEQPLLHPAAAMAVKELCFDCSEHICGSIQIFMDICAPLLASEVTIVRVNTIDGIASLVNAMPPQAADHHAAQLIGALLHDLKRIHERSDIAVDSLVSVVQMLNAICLRLASSVFQDPSSLTLKSLNEVLEIMISLIARVKCNQVVVTATCRCLKSMLQSLGAATKYLLSLILQILMLLLAHTRDNSLCADVLSTMGQITTTLQDEGESVEVPLLKAHCAMVQILLGDELKELAEEGKISTSFDLHVSALLFRHLRTVLLCCPGALISLPEFPMVVHIAAVSLRQQENFLGQRALLMFLKAVVEKPRREEHKRLMEMHAKQSPLLADIVGAVIGGARSGLSSSVCPVLASILSRLMCNYTERTGALFEKYAQSYPEAKLLLQALAQCTSERELSQVLSSIDKRPREA